MARLLERSKIHLNGQQLEQLWHYHNLLRKRNVGNELTRIIGFEPIVIKHYVDCLIVGKYVSLPSPIVDVGSGPGFPGIPLKIRYPHLKITLAEPRPKRVEFLNEVIKELGLKNIDVFDHKVVSRSLTRPMKAVITRAVETIDKTILRTSGCLEQGGLLVFMKGPAVDPEIQNVQKRFKDQYRLLSDDAYDLPHTEHHRRIVVFERLSPLEPVGV